MVGLPSTKLLLEGLVPTLGSALKMGDTVEVAGAPVPPLGTAVAVIGVAAPCSRFEGAAVPPTGTVVVSGVVVAPVSGAVVAPVSGAVVAPVSGAVVSPVRGAVVAPVSGAVVPVGSIAVVVPVCDGAKVCSLLRT